MALAPTTIKRHGKDCVEIAWTDGHRSLYPNRYLRDNCPCAACREGKPGRLLPVLGNPGEIYPVQIGVVGRYAINIQWSDHHDTGIYSYDTLRQLCPCERCRPAAPGDATA
jgi:DUF971 family protein